MISLEEMLGAAVERNASDIFIVPGACPMMKVNGVMNRYTEEWLRPEETEQLITQIYAMARSRTQSRLIDTGDDDFSFSMKNLGRFRCNAFRQRGTLAAVLRVVAFGVPDYRALEIPETVMRLADVRRGLVLVTGPAGSGKSTTLSCIIDRINAQKAEHIVTIEDPIEFLHPHRLSIVSQREVEHDTLGYAQALRAALRQAPDAVLLGEMRDFETIQTALTAAETGHVVYSTLHTVGAAKTVDRMIDVFPANQQQQTRVQLSMVLQAVVSQQLLPTVDGKLAPAFEIMLANSAVSNIIREGKTYQLDNAIFSGGAQGMVSMDADILRLYKEKRITRETAMLYCVNADTMRKKLGV